ncbi:MAG: hypothetical protein WD029_08045, partial [Microthrixaceae bacterium]
MIPSAQKKKLLSRLPLALVMFFGMCILLGQIGINPAAAQDTPEVQPGQRLPTRGPVKSNSVPEADRDVNLVDGLLRGVPIVEGDYAHPFALAE